MGSFDYLASSGLLESHHNAAQDAKSGEIIHVFAFTGPPTFGDTSTDRHHFDIHFSVGPVTFEVSITATQKTLILIMILP